MAADPKRHRRVSTKCPVSGAHSEFILWFQPEQERKHAEYAGRAPVSLRSGAAHMSLDMTAQECRQLAHELLEVAELIETQGGAA
jgi:hypothetical protein